MFASISFSSIKMRTLALMIIVLLTGLFIPQAIWSNTRTASVSIPVPGSSLKDTIFSELIGESFDGGAYYGEWSIDESAPFVAVLKLANSSLSVDEGQEVCSTFLREPLKSLLILNTGTYIDPEHKEWRYHFVGNGVSVNIWLNPISGVVVAYEEAWENATYLEATLGDFEGLLSEASVEAMALDYLRSIDYVASEDMLYLGIEFIPNGTLDIPEYLIRFTYANNGVLPDEYLEGLTLQINAHHGWIHSFSRRRILLPFIDTSNVITPSLVEELVREEMGEELNAIEVGGLHLALRGWESPWRSSSLRFSLAWHIQIEASTVDGLVLKEAFRDAYTGERFHPTPLYLHVGVLGERMVFFLILVPVWCFGLAAVAFLLTKRKVSRALEC